MNKNNKKFLKSIIFILTINFININTIISAADLKDKAYEPKKGPIEKYEEGVSKKLKRHFPDAIEDIISQYTKVDISDDKLLEEQAALLLDVNYPLYAPGTHKLLQPSEILNLVPGRSYSPREISSARRKKILPFHPDKNPNISPESYTRISQIINEAYDQLTTNR